VAVAYGPGDSRGTPARSAALTLRNGRW